MKTTLLEVLYVLYMCRIWLKTRSTDAEDGRGATVAALRRALAQAGTIVEFLERGDSLSVGRGHSPAFRSNPLVVLGEGIVGE